MDSNCTLFIHSKPANELIRKITTTTKTTINLSLFIFAYFCFIPTKKGERNLENVSHEDAVATLKSITDKVTLVLGKTNLGINNVNSIGLSNSNSHSTSAVNSIGQSVVDHARSQSPAAAAISSRSHSPRNIYNQFIYLLFSILVFLCFSFDLQRSVCQCVCPFVCPSIFLSIVFE